MERLSWVNLKKGPSVKEGTRTMRVLKKLWHLIDGSYRSPKRATAAQETVQSVTHLMRWSKSLSSIRLSSWTKGTKTIEASWTSRTQRDTLIINRCGMRVAIHRSLSRTRFRISYLRVRSSRRKQRISIKNQIKTISLNKSKRSKAWFHKFIPSRRRDTWNVWRGWKGQLWIDNDWLLWNTCGGRS